MVGSIGVVAAIPKQVQPGTDGYVDIEIVSSNAPNKRPDPESEDGASQIRGMLDAIEGEFIADVARGRGITAAKVKSDFGQGGMLMGAAAVIAGMADKVQSQEASFNALRRAVANARKLQSLKN
jgi:ClpP class serine protease